MSNKARKWRSVIASVLVVCMLFSIFPTAAFANTGNDANEAIKYVSLGDSMTNGYGLTGYNGNTGVEDYGDQSYTNQFAADLGAEHAQLAMSAMRAEDLHWLLEVDYGDPAVIDIINTLASNEKFYNDNIKEFDALWYSVFTNGDYWTWAELVNNYRFDVAAYCIEGKADGDVEFKTSDAYNAYTDIEALQIVAQYYQESVANANIVSLGIGNGNFGVFMFGRIMEAIGFDGNPEEAMIYDIDNAIQECDPELQAQLLTLMAEAEVILASKGIVADDGDDSTVSSMEALYNTFMYATISYALNYAGTVEAILQLNPDAEIIQVALMNTIKSNNSIEGEITLGDAMDALIIPLNAYLAALPTVMQTADNSVYNQATFYWAEAPYVECIVDTYEEGNLNNIVRDRFFQSIVKDENNKAGMVWGMLGDMVCDITLDEIKAYEDMDEAQKLAYAASSADKAMSISMYLAFEKAIVVSKENSVGINAIMGLTDLFVPGADPFGPIMTEFYKQAAVAGAEKQDLVAQFIADNSNSELNKEQVMNLVNAIDEDALDAVIYSILAEKASNLATDILGNPITITAGQVEAMCSKELAVQNNALYTLVCEISGLDVTSVEKLDSEGSIVVVAAMKGLLPEQVQYIYDNPEAAGHDEIKAGVDKLNNVIQKMNFIRTAIPTLQDGADMMKGVPETANLLITLLVMPEELGDVVSKSELSGLLALFARCVIGNGIGSHPSENGHNDLYVAVKDAYENGYTAKDKTVENLQIALEEVSKFVAEYYDEAYAYAYAEAKDAGYIDNAVNAIDDVIKALENIDLSEAGMTAELEAKVKVEIAEIIDTLEAAQKLILEADVLDQATLDSLMALLNEAGQDMEQLLVVLEQAGVDVNDLVIIPALNEAYNILINEVVPEIERNLQEAMEAGIAWLMEQAPEAMEALKEALYDLAVQTGDDIYWFLYNNPDKVVGFFNEYGDDMLVLMEDYGPYALAAMGWIAQNYGEEILDFVVENHVEIIDVTAMLLEKHGENAAKLINVYAEYLGWCDEVRDLIADVEGEIEDLKAQLEELNNQLEDLYAQLENLYEELENASEEAKAEIEAAIEQIEEFIAEVEAAIEQIEDAIEQLETQLEELEAQLEEAYKAIEAIVEAIEEAVESGIETVEEILEVIEAVVDYAEETIAGVKTAVEAIVEAVEAIVDFTEELIANGIIAAEEIEKLVDYLYDVMDGVMSELEEGDIEGAIEAIRDKLTNGYDVLIAMLAALDATIAEELASILEDLEAGLEEAEKEFQKAMYNATHGTFGCEAEVIAVAGGATVATEDGYAAIVADEWGLEEGNVEDADVILYQMDPQIFVQAVQNAVEDILNGEYESEWDTYITDEEVLTYLEEAKAVLVEELAEIYGEEVVAMLDPLVDSLLFAAVDYAVKNIEVIEQVKELNEEALIVAVGMYNPVQDLTVTMEGEEIDIEELCQYVIEATDVYNLLYAMASQNVVFVDVSEADAEAAGNVNIDRIMALYAEAEALVEQAKALGEAADGLPLDQLMELMGQIEELTNQALALKEQAEAEVAYLWAMYEDLDDNYATAEGHAYMAEQILAAITQADHEVGSDWVFDKANHWKECAICGEVFDKDAHEYSGSKDKTCNVCGYERKVSSGGGGAAMPVKPAVKGQDAFMSGYPDGTFGPDRQITRGEVAAMFARLMADKAVAGKVYTNDFTDVPASLWSANAIGFMQEMGVVKGYTDGTFRPEQPITRAEFVAMASRFEAATGTALVTFTDVPANHWAANVIKAAAAAGWVGGYEDGTFRPDNNITRAEATAVMCNVLDIEANVAYITANAASLKNFSDVTKAHWAYWDIMAAVNGGASVK